jgi:hypothetical protein
MYKIRLFSSSIFIKRIAKIWSISIFALFACNTTSIPTTYYVAKNGSDSNRGTETEPWLTIQNALDETGAGDTIVVKEGIYNENIKTDADGEAGKRILIKAQKGVILKGGVLIKHSYITIDGFEITDIKGKISIKAKGDANYIEILNCNIHDLSNGARFFIELPRSKGTPSGPTGWLIKGNHFHSEKHSSLIYMLLGGRDHIIENNELGPGIVREDALRPFGDNHIIRNNYIHGITSGGGHTDIMQIFMSNGWRVRNLLFEKNFINGWDGQAWMFSVTDDSEGIIIRNNIFVDVRSAGQSYCPRTEVYNNTFVNSAYGNCRMVMIRSESGRGLGTNSRVKNNIFYNTGCDGKHGWYVVEGKAQDSFEGDFNLIYPVKRKFQETNGINGEDPNFVSQQDYHLQSQSPAIDAGVTLPGFNDDIESNYRPQGPAWDIGATEYMTPIIRGKLPKNEN